MQGARPIDGVPISRQGAGVAADTAPVGASLRIEPAIVATTTRKGAVRAAVALHALGGAPGRYSISLRTGSVNSVVNSRVTVRRGRDTPVALTLPRGGEGELVVRDATGGEVARAPVVPSRPAVTPGGALGRPEVSVGPRFAEVRVRLGALRRADARLSNVKLHGVRLELVPAGGGAAALPVAGQKQSAAWAAGTYRFLVARRLASGLQAPAGRYRLRARAVGPDGAVLTSTSESFRLR